MDELKVGDVVTLKGHENPKMVIDHISQKTEGNIANCVWFVCENHVYQSGNFNLLILKRSE